MRGETVGLRALEPEDVSVLYRWENDPQVWRVSGTLAPFSRHALARFIEEQQLDIYATRQQRLVIETVAGGVAVGAVDLFDFDPLHGRAGVGFWSTAPRTADGGMRVRRWTCSRSTPSGCSDFISSIATFSATMRSAWLFSRGVASCAAA